MTLPPPLPPSSSSEPNWGELEAMFAAGEIGFDRSTHMLRTPEDNEYVDDTGRIELIFDRIRTSRRRARPLPKFASLRDVQRELGKLYADMHHDRIKTADFTKRAYVLSLMAQVLRMQDKPPASQSGMSLMSET